jgi:hypothetical protein
VIEKALLSLALSGLGRDALKVAAGLGLAVLLALAFAISSLMALFGAAAPGYAIAGAELDEIPPDQLPAMGAAAATCGLPWPLLAAIAKVESDFGRNMATSSAGAIGYGQFLPATWAAYGKGGDPYDFRDALPAMARYLCDHGAPGDLRAALFAYNHAEWYVDQVLAVAVRYGYLAPGTRAARVLDLARAQIGKPYVWGGASPESSFDCSGLVQWVYRQVGVALPRSAQGQFDATLRLTPDQLQPGDLVFFQICCQPPDRVTHVGIYLGHGQMVHASFPGDIVRITSIQTPYWQSQWAGAGRVVGLPPGGGG